MPEIFSCRPVTIKRGGRAYNASWRQAEGRVRVDSAYGSDGGGKPVGRKDPKVVAERLLDEIVARTGH